MTKKLLLLACLILLVACGEQTTPTPRFDTPNATSQSGGATLPPTTADGSPIAVPFFTPTVSDIPTTGDYSLVFDDKPNSPILEASSIGLTALPTDWEVTITSNGQVRYTTNPRDKTNALTQERYLNPEKQQNLLQELGKLGVLSWPNTSQGTPSKLSRSLSLYLKGQPKLITDLSGKTDDKLATMLTLIKQTVEAAPPPNAP